MHQCFRRGCTVQVLDRYLACYDDWKRLTPAVQRGVLRTVGLHLMHPERRAALKAVKEEWGD